MNDNAFVRIGLVAGLIVSLAACQGKLLSTEGKFVAEEKRIVLPPEGSASGSWQGKRDLAVNYTVSRTQDALQMSGTVVFKRHKKLDSFRLSVVLIDANGNVREVVGISSAGGRRKYDQLPFNRELQLPAGTRSFAFAYDGVTRGTGEGGSPNSFWSAPW